MALYSLNYKNDDLSDGVLEIANKKDIDYEKDFENWLENSPHILNDSEDDSNIIWIGRQVTAIYEDRYKFPDLMGIDADGNIVIVELKKGRTPRDVVAQILEYAAWAEKLTYDELNVITMKYYENKSEFHGLELSEIHRKVFFSDADEKPQTGFNNRLRMFIVAEQISNTVKDVIYFLNKNGVDISCLKYDVYSNETGEIYISTEIEEAKSMTSKVNRKLNINNGRWSGDKAVKEIVKEAVNQVLALKENQVFTMKEVIDTVIKNYPDANKNTLRCQLYTDCVNHNSRKHYKGGQKDYYYQVEGTTFRLYDSNTDGKWNSEGLKIG